MKILKVAGKLLLEGLLFAFFLTIAAAIMIGINMGLVKLFGITETTGGYITIGVFVIIIFYLKLKERLK